MTKVSSPRVSSPRRKHVDESAQYKPTWAWLPALLILSLFISVSLFFEPGQVTLLGYAFQARVVNFAEQVSPFWNLDGGLVPSTSILPVNTTLVSTEDVPFPTAFQPNSSDSASGFTSPGRIGGTPSMNPPPAQIQQQAKSGSIATEEQQEDIVQQDHIPGTSLNSSVAVSAFLSSLRCMAEEGYWFRNTTPRWHAYGRMTVGAVTNCDKYFAATTPGATVGRDAEEARKNGTEWKVRDAIMYQWQMKEGASCQYRQFDRDHFCHLLGRRPNVLVVGDSISTHFGMTLMEHIIPVTNFNSTEEAQLQTFWNGHGFHCGHQNCLPIQGCQDVLQSSPIQLRIVRNDHLWMNTSWIEHYSPWVRMLDTWQPDLVILNRGAHYTPDDVYAAEVEQVIAQVRSRFPELLLVWRSTPPGHRLDEGERVLERRQADMARPDDSLKLQFHWADFQRQNGIAKRIMDKYGVVFMDVDPMTSLRADGHIPHFREPGPEVGNYEIKSMDGLHYCVPGPLDAWVTMLYNVLLLADASDVHDPQQEQ